MKNKVAITTESACDLSFDEAEKSQIKIIAMNIFLDGEEFKDGVDIDAKTLFEKSRLKKEVPKTAGISPYEYGEFFSALVKSGFDVVHVALSGKISSCFQNALFAAKSFDNVFVVDSLSLSGGLALLSKKAARLRDEGMSAEKIAKEIEKSRSCVSVSFILQDINALYKGGRCNALELFSSNVFSIHPSLKLCGGRLFVEKRYRGKIENARKQYISDKLEKSEIAKNSPCILCHSGLSKAETDGLVSLLSSAGRFESVSSNQTGCCIATHCGKGCMGIIFEETKKSSTI